MHHRILEHLIPMLEVTEERSALQLGMQILVENHLGCVFKLDSTAVAVSPAWSPTYQDS